MKKRTKWKIVVCATILLVGASVIAGEVRSLSDDSWAGKSVTVLQLDQSGSTNRDIVRQNYRAAADQIVAQQRDGDILLIRPITDDPATGAFTTTTIPMPRFIFWHVNLVAFHFQETAARSRARAATDRIINSVDSAPGTDLFTALVDDGLVFANARQRGATNLNLVICSDMLQEYGGVDLASDNIDAAHRAAILQRLQAEGRMASLPGVNVTIVGATAGCRPPLSPQRCAQIEAFWLEYFRQAGAQLPQEQYGPTLISSGNNETDEDRPLGVGLRFFSATPRNEAGNDPHKATLPNTLSRLG